MPHPDPPPNDTARILRLLASMSEPARTVFLLHRVDAEPLEAIARRLGIPADAVERHLADAMLHLDQAPLSGDA